MRTGFVVQRIKPQGAMMDSQIRAPIKLPTALLPIIFFANKPGKASKDNSGAWVPATDMTDPNGVTCS